MSSSTLLTQIVTAGPAAARAFVMSVCSRMLKSARRTDTLSRLLLIAMRDWDKWLVPEELGAYYRARAVQVAYKYQQAIKEAEFQQQLARTVVSGI